MRELLLALLLIAGILVAAIIVTLLGYVFLVLVKSVRKELKKGKRDE